MYVGYGLKSAAHRLGHVGAAEKTESHDGALFGQPNHAELRQTEVQKVQLHQQRGVAAQFDVNAHDLPQDGDTCDFNARADQTDGNREGDAEHRDEQRHFRACDKKRRIMCDKRPVEHVSPPRLSSLFACPYPMRTVVRPV